jgi:hypothetical protein
MCDPCAEEHFGKTVAQWRIENPVVDQEQSHE